MLRRASIWTGSGRFIGSRVHMWQEGAIVALIRRMDALCPSEAQKGHMQAAETARRQGNEKEIGVGPVQER